MAEHGTIARDQLILRHIAGSAGDWLVEIGVDNPRRWQSAVEEMTLSLTSVRAVISRSLGQRKPLECSDGGVEEKSAASFTLVGVSQSRGYEDAAYGIDVSEGDPDYLIAQRVDGDIGVDLISRSPEVLQGNGLLVPFASEVFVSTDGWYYGDAESVRLLFDIPEADLWELHDNLRGGQTGRLDLTVSLRRWIPTEANPGQQVSERRVTPIIYGYGGYARLTKWTVVSLLR
jgi:hypothetical protein